MALDLRKTVGPLFLTHAFVVIYVSISHTRFKSLVCALIDQYLAMFLGSVDAYC